MVRPSIGQNVVEVVVLTVSLAGLFALAAIGEVGADRVVSVVQIVIGYAAGRAGGRRVGGSSPPE